MASKEVIEAKKQYMDFLKTIQPKTRELMREYLDKVEKSVGAGEITLAQMPAIKKEIATAAKEFNKGMKEVTKQYAFDGVKQARKAKEVQYLPYLDKARKELSKGVGKKVADEILETPRIKTVFGGGLDKKITDKVWDRVWPDKLNVDDRINRLSKRLYDKAEQIIRQGVIEGTSAVKLGKQIEEATGVEGRMATRLAATTIGQTYNAAQAEISIQTVFVEGILIERAIDGDENCEICDFHAGSVGGSGKEFYKEDFGGQTYDVYVMANAPIYHNNCKCMCSDITIPIEKFITDAREEYANEKGYSSWNEMMMNK